MHVIMDQNKLITIDKELTFHAVANMRYTCIQDKTDILVFYVL